MNTIKVKAQMENLELLMDFFRTFAKQSDFSSEQLMKIELAFEEVVVNVINYAYPQDDVRDVEVIWEKSDKDRLRVTVIDDGIPFDPLEKEDPDVYATLEERQIGGLGVFLAKQMMDEIRYIRKDNKNILVLTKH